MTRVRALALSEARIIRRNALVAATALLLPLGVGLLLVANGERGAWGEVIAMQLVLLLLFCVYATATTSLAARRRQLVLKRLRSGELSDAEILGGLLAPLYVLALVQAGVLLAVAFAFGAPLPARGWLLVPALELGALLSATAALATTAFTASAELDQITVAPFLFAVIASAGWALSVEADAVTWLMRATPGGALADLIRQAWDPGGQPLGAIASLLAWTAIAAAVAKRWFRWEPRR
jgi:ABC-2 type transport system permease protein